MGIWDAIFPLLLFTVDTLLIAQQANMESQNLYVEFHIQ